MLRHLAAMTLILLAAGTSRAAESPLGRKVEDFKLRDFRGEAHALFDQAPVALGWDRLREQRFAGLGYHSPNMQMTQAQRLPRSATGFDQESIATLILSGKFLGFLPIHYAQSFVDAGQMRAVQPPLIRIQFDQFREQPLHLARQERQRQRLQQRQS